MESRGTGFYFVLIDNKARGEGLPLVEAADDATALLRLARERFDERVTTITSDRLLQEFTLDKLGPRVRGTEGFDPELFRAVALFELAHLSEDESVIAECAQMLANVWAGTVLSDEDREINFTAPTKRAHYSPFDTYSDFIIWSCIGEYSNNRRIPPQEPVADPLQQDIDGPEMEVSIGGQKIEFDEHPVLTRQLIRDLKKLFPAHIVEELKFRFPEGGTFEDIHPFIGQIQHERAQGIVPPSDEILAAALRADAKRPSLFGKPRKRKRTMTAEKATEMFKERFRDIRARIHGDEEYVPALKAWFVILLLASETEADTFYRRIWHGDLSAENAPEVRPEEKVPVIEALRSLAAERKNFDHLLDGGEEQYIIDMFGAWDVEG